MAITTMLLGTQYKNVNYHINNLKCEGEEKYNWKV